MIEEKAELALKLLSMAEGELSVKEAMEIIRSVSKLNEVALQALSLGEARGIVERRGDKIYVRAKEPLEHTIAKRECKDSCRRCGRKITLCHYILIEGEELGPYGSECIKFVSGL